MSKKEKIKEYEKTEQAAPQDGDAPQDDTDAVKVEVAGDEDALQKKLEAVQAESQERYDRLLRVSAEFDNFKKRSAREAEEFRKFANEALLKDLLHVVDNLERAIVSANETGEANACVVEGVQMTASEILKTFAKFGVTPVEAVGKPFDPAFHQAIMQEESREHPENTVVSEMQKGYLLHDRLLRPAMVAVSKGAPSSEGASDETKTEE